MLAHPPRAASCQSSVDLVVQHSSAPCALNFVGALLLGENPRFARTCRLRCRSSSSSSTKHVERLAAGRGGRRGRGKDIHNELRSCRVAPISAAEVEGSSAVDSGSHSPVFDVGNAHHESTAALISNGAKAAAQDGEWQSFGRDGTVERLSTSSSSKGGSGLLAFKSSSLGKISLETTGLETFQNVEWPVDQDSGTAAEEGLEVRNGKGLHNVRIGHHPEIYDATEAHEDEEGHILVAAQEGLIEEQLLVELPEIRKWTSLSVRKPSQEPPAEIDPVPRVSQVKIAERRDERPEPQREPELQEDLEYFIPKVGDEVTGVVVSGTEYQLDIEIGAKQLGRMLSKDLKPFDVFRADEFFWELDESGSSMPATSLGQCRFLGDREALRPTYPLVPVGTVLTLEVIGLTLSGRAVLSARKVAGRIAWQRARQIHEQDEPIEAQCVAWNSDGLVFKIEGLRAILPLNQFLNRSKAVSLKDHVGEWKNVLIMNVDEASGTLVVSEKRAWSGRNLRIGSLVVGTVQRILPFGVEIILDETSLRAMLHISHISRFYIPDIKSVFNAGEKVKALVINSGNPHKIGLSTADLESSPGLMLQDKKRVFQEAEEMAARQQRPLSEDGTNEYGKDIDTQTKIEYAYPANQDWLDFGRGEISMLDS